MLLGTLKQSGGRHHEFLVFVILNAASHGLRHTDPQYYECSCGNELSPAELDLGDHRKQSWPDCMSWRNGGQKHCPVCGERVSVSPEERARAKGYELISEDEHDEITDEDRETVFDRYEEECIACDQPSEAVHRIIPPSYGGSGDPMNLVPVCKDHRHRRGHKFLDIMMPWEWDDVAALDWGEYVEDLRNKYSEKDSEAAERIVDICEKMLERERPMHPNPYADSRLEANPNFFELVDGESQSMEDIVESLDGEFGVSGAPELGVEVIARHRFDMDNEEVLSIIESMVERGDLFRPEEGLLKAV